MTPKIPVALVLVLTFWFSAISHATDINLMQLRHSKLFNKMYILGYLS